MSGISAGGKVFKKVMIVTVSWVKNIHPSIRLMMLSQAYKSSLSVSHPPHEACSTPTWYAPVTDGHPDGDMTTYHALQLAMSVSYSRFPPKQTNYKLPSILSLP